jgi:hypothetical protein
MVGMGNAGVATARKSAPALQNRGPIPARRPSNRVGEQPDRATARGQPLYRNGTVAAFRYSRPPSSGYRDSARTSRMTSR